jgi:hypothetical protein
MYQQPTLQILPGQLQVIMLLPVQGPWRRVPAQACTAKAAMLVTTRVPGGTKSDATWCEWHVFVGSHSRRHSACSSPRGLLDVGRCCAATGVQHVNQLEGASPKSITAWTGR